MLDAAKTTTGDSKQAGCQGEEKWDVGKQGEISDSFEAAELDKVGTSLVGSTKCRGTDDVFGGERN